MSGTTATLVRLKLSLLRGALRADVWQVIGTLLAGASALGAGAVLLAVSLPLRRLDVDVVTAAAVLGGSLLTLGWALVPLVSFGVDETLDPARFALLPVPARRLVPGLVLAGLVGAPGIATGCAGLAGLVVWSRYPVAGLVAVPAAAVAVLTCVVASRLVTTAAARALGGRRGRDASSVLVLLAVAGIGLVPMSLTALASQGLDLTRVVGVLGWTPLGLAWGAPAAVAAGELGAGLTRLALAAAVLFAAGAAWGVLLDRELTTTASGSGGRRAVRRSILDRVPAGPVWAVAGRRMLAWRRDPRYLGALAGPLIASAMPVVATLGFGSDAGEDGGRAALVIIGPICAGLLGLTSGNDIGYDGSAFAAHLITGVPGRADRWGRTLGSLAVGLPLTVGVALTGCVLAGRLDLAPGLLGICLALLLTGHGAGSVAGAAAPYPMPAPGTNPFKANSGSSVKAVGGQFAVLGVTGACALPPIVLAVAGGLAWTPLLWLALVVGAGIGATALTVGTRIAGTIVDQRGPEILAAVRRSS